jgi:hypothetical protein
MNSDYFVIVSYDLLFVEFNTSITYKPVRFNSAMQCCVNCIPAEN